jgi:hypothetical protein
MKSRPYLRDEPRQIAYEAELHYRRVNGMPLGTAALTGRRHGTGETRVLDLRDFGFGIFRWQRRGEDDYTVIYEFRGTETVVWDGTQPQAPQTRPSNWNLGLDDRVSRGRGRKSSTVERRYAPTCPQCFTQHAGECP